MSLFGPMRPSLRPPKKTRRNINGLICHRCEIAVMGNEPHKFLEICIGLIFCKYQPSHSQYTVLLPGVACGGLSLKMPLIQVTHHNTRCTKERERGRERYACSIFKQKHVWRSIDGQSLLPAISCPSSPLLRGKIKDLLIKQETRLFWSLCTKNWLTTRVFQQRKNYFGSCTNFCFFPASFSSAWFLAPSANANLFF